MRSLVVLPRRFRLLDGQQQLHALLLLELEALASGADAFRRRRLEGDLRIQGENGINK